MGNRVSLSGVTQLDGIAGEDSEFKVIHGNLTAFGGRKHKTWTLVRRVVGATVLAVSIALIGLLATTNHSFVTTPSMWPTIPPGSMIFVASEPSYKVGEVIEFRANGLVWAHRLIAISKSGDYMTKGDNPENSPDVFVPPVTRSDIIGRVVAAPRFLGFPELFVHRPAYALSWFVTEIGTGGKVAILGLEILLLSIFRRRFVRSHVRIASVGGDLAVGSEPR